MTNLRPKQKRWIAFKCPNNDSACGVEWTCDSCRVRINREADARLTPQQRAYDNMVLSPSYRSGSARNKE